MAIKKIMVVDDSATELAFAERMLRKGGYQVLTVDNGEGTVARSKTEQPDLILMDVVMPGLNGFQATRAITHEESTKHIRSSFAPPRTRSPTRSGACAKGRRTTSSSR